MKCPYCAYLESKVVDSRPAEEGASIRRRRECLSCHKRFTTYETVESLPLVVVKRDGSRQSFDRNKVMGGFCFSQITQHIQDKGSSQKSGANAPAAFFKQT